MKVLTVRDPWATLLAVGAKEIETRSWFTRYRGEVAIHASKGLSADESLSSLVPPISRALDRFLPLKIAARPEKWPRGAIVAVGTLVEIWPITRYRGEQVVSCQVDGHDHRAGDVVTVGSEPVSDKEEGLGLYCTGRFGWLIADIRRVVPVPAKGRLGLWTFDGDLVSA